MQWGRRGGKVEIKLVVKLFGGKANYILTPVL